MWQQAQQGEYGRMPMPNFGGGGGKFAPQPMGGGPMGMPGMGGPPGLITDGNPNPPVGRFPQPKFGPPGGPRRPGARPGFRPPPMPQAMVSQVSFEHGGQGGMPVGAYGQGGAQPQFGMNPMYGGGGGQQQAPPQTQGWISDAVRGAFGPSFESYRRPIGGSSNY